MLRGWAYSQLSQLWQLQEQLISLCIEEEELSIYFVPRLTAKKQDLVKVDGSAVITFGVEYLLLRCKAGPTDLLNTLKLLYLR